MIGIETKTTYLDDTTVVLSVDGELDLDTAARFERDLKNAAASGAPAVIVDLTMCEFVDSSALTVLVRTHKHLERNRRLSLVIPRPNILKVFEITHLDQTFPIHPTREAVLNDTHPAASAGRLRPAASGR